MADDDEPPIITVENLNELVQCLEVIYDLGGRQRTELELRGWSPTVAEGLGASTMHCLIHALFRDKT